MFFGGNLVRQPAFVQLKADTMGAGFRVIGDLAGADRVMNQSLFTGTYPGLTAEHIAYIVATIRKAVGAP
jgi:CDP-6-deoxy-D-xylo-4-hexulose-3-dehydrase